MTRLLIIAADPLIRSALANIADQSDDLQVVGQASTEDEPTELVEVYRPDVVIYDAGWGLSSDDLTTDLTQIPADWTLPVILLIPDSDETVSQLLNAGFNAILPRSIDPDRLNGAVQAALLDLTVIDPIFLEEMALVATKPSAPIGFVEVEPLTPREFDVLELLADGLTNREIGAKLEISHHTVKFHLTSLMDKLDVHSRTEAVTTASRLGILEI
ncbi:MAG: response regulator transcription factor [Anaerolineae bacterium]